MACLPFFCSPSELESSSFRIKFYSPLNNFGSPMDDLALVLFTLSNLGGIIPFIPSNTFLSVLRTFVIYEVNGWLWNSKFPCFYLISRSGGRFINEDL